MPLFTVPDDADRDGLERHSLDVAALRSRERISVKVLNNSEDASFAVAKEIAALIRQKASEGKDSLSEKRIKGRRSARRNVVVRVKNVLKMHIVVMFS